MKSSFRTVCSDNPGKCTLTAWRSERDPPPGWARVFISARSLPDRWGLLPRNPEDPLVWWLSSVAVFMMWAAALIPLVGSPISTCEDEHEEAVDNEISEPESEHNMDEEEDKDGWNVPNGEGFRIFRLMKELAGTGGKNSLSFECKTEKLKPMTKRSIY